MSDTETLLEASPSRPSNNAVTATDTDWNPGDAPEALDAYAVGVDRVLRLTAELARNLVGAHQSAAALIVSGDWPHARKWFSLSTKYADWFEYHAPATGVGLHALVVQRNEPLRLTQAEVEAHPDWRAFGSEADSHPPMRGWLAVPLVGADGHNYGLLQLSDKYNDADFTADDEQHLALLAQLTAASLDSLRTLHEDERIGARS